MKHTHTHTPGPWSAYGCAIMSGLPNAGGRAELDSRYIGNSAPECPDDMPNWQDLSNALLIAAAPDMLDALLIALPYVQDVLDNPEQLACFKKGAVEKDAKAIRAAISKAIGDL